MNPTEYPRPTAFSVAGFKALPFDNPPVMPLEGVVVLMGTNSSGKSSLLLALRLLVVSLLQEPRLERLHLRLPELPQLRLTSSIDLVDEARLLSHMANIHAATGQPGHRELTFRIGFSDGHILECRFSLPEPPALRGSAPNPMPANPLHRAALQPSTLHLASSPNPLQLLLSTASDPRDLWSATRTSATTALHFERLADRLAHLRSWANQVGFLDSIRGEPSLGALPEAILQDLDAPAVSPDGRNATALLAGIENDDYGFRYISSSSDSYPETGLSHYLPRHDQVRTHFPEYRQPTALDVVSHLMEWCGLEPMEFANVAPGLTSDLRRKGSSLTLAQLGDGQRQALPVLTQAYLSHRGTTMSWEHPDLHLHPGAATAIGRLAYRLGATGRTVLIETHSRDLVDGVRTEAASVRIDHARGFPTPLRMAPATLLYLERTENGARVNRYNLDDPAVQIPLWPGFVAPEVRERREFDASNQADLQPLTPEEVERLLKQGEGQRLEWKASLSWNRELGRSDGAVTFRVMRAIASLCNSDGGWLLLGVDDDGNPVGLDPQLADWDAYQQHFANVVSRDFGPAFWDEHLELSCVAVRGHTLAAVRCRRAKRPVLLRNARLQRDQCFVRTGNTTRAVDPALVPQWMSDRFGA
jgi:AAA domain, putative AbiEii toxin, Type IV TA system/Putative DNA-binding domain